MTYFNKLSDKRWIRKRKKIMERDGFKCTACGSLEHLVVHHTFYYKKPIAPWHYPEDSLITLCDSCHTQWHYYHENVIENNPHKRRRRKSKGMPTVVFR